MAYDEILAERVNDILTAQGVRFKQKKMFGGVAFMVKDKMCVGVLKHDLMLRFDPAIEDTVLAKPGVREMDFTGRPMRGYAFVDPTGTGSTVRLKSFIGLALEFNPKAASAKKKKKQSGTGRKRS